MQTKKCSGCHDTKQLDAFWAGSGRYGRQGYCKPCSNTANRRDKAKPSAVAVRKARDARRQATPGWKAFARDMDLRRRYNITAATFDAMLAGQGGTCALCPAPGTDLDHDHACCSRRARSCGKCIRGILCSNCNNALGRVHDDPTILRNAATYLEAFRVKATA